MRVQVEGEGGGCRVSPAWRGEGACQRGAWGLRLGALLAVAEGPSRASARCTWKSLGYKLPVLKLQAQAAGYKLQATSYKATSYKLQAASYKLQAAGYKLQAASYKLQALKWHAPGRA